MIPQWRNTDRPQCAALTLNVTFSSVQTSQVEETVRWMAGGMCDAGSGCHTWTRRSLGGPPRDSWKHRAHPGRSLQTQGNTDPINHPGLMSSQRKWGAQRNSFSDTIRKRTDTFVSGTFYRIINAISLQAQKMKRRGKGLSLIQRDRRCSDLIWLPIRISVLWEEVFETIG